MTAPKSLPQIGTPMTTITAASTPIATRMPARVGTRHDEQPGEEHRRGRQLREGHVPFADEPDADGRRVPEDGVPLEVRARHQVEHVQHHDAAERDEDAAHEVSPADGEEHDREHERDADDEGPVRDRAAVAAEVHGCGEVRRVEEPDQREREEDDDPGAARADHAGRTSRRAASRRAR